MTHPDDGLEALKAVKAEFAAFCTAHGSATEADTRAKVIDQVLTAVLGWPEADLTREEAAQPGFLDYCLRVHKRPYVVVEAKREGLTFALPLTSHSRTLKISGALATHRDVHQAVVQARSYCDSIGSRYGVATNGYSWIVFRAIREDIPWREGAARVFPSLDHIIEHFTDFWNLLSYEALVAGSLDSEFGSPARVERRLGRVLDKLFNADLPLQRNRLHAQLFPLVKSVFEDIADQDQVEILQSCYVHSASLRIVATDLNCVIEDAVPHFLVSQGAEEITQGPDHAGRFERAVIHAVTEFQGQQGQLFLLLGGIGCGKTTFLKRYQRAVGTDLLDKHTFFFHVDLLAAPLDPRDMELEVWRIILDQARRRYAGGPYLEARRNLKRAFAGDIEALRQTTLRSQSGEAFEAALSPYLERWQQDLSTYVPKLLVAAANEYHRSLVVFVDNVDQLAPGYQGQVFLLAQRVTRLLGSTTIVSLREESYYSATVQKTFTAYSNRKFHIASPRFRHMIANRIRYALKWLDDPAQRQRPSVMSAGIKMDHTAIADLLKIVEYSIFEQNRNIARFIEAICFGNMRLALEMFTTFLGSGATDVDKMLRIYRQDGAYFVAYHEFVKSIMLGDRKYYKETQSPVMNLFDVGPEKNASHFTASRLLRYLLSRRGQSSPEGQGYCELSEAISAFEDLFDNREDVLKTLTRLVGRQLVETDTRSTETIAGAAWIRVTSAGWYYAGHLMNSFTYLDLVLQDTPLNDASTEATLRQSVYRVDNLGGREEDKIPRMQARFERVEVFLRYLEREEQAEAARWGLVAIKGDLTDSTVTSISARVAAEKAWIERRVRENRERFAEDLKLPAADEIIDAEGDAEVSEDAGK